MVFSRQIWHLPLASSARDKVHDRPRILGCERIVSLALLDDDFDFPAKFLVSPYNLKRIVSEIRVEAAADMLA